MSDAPDITIFVAEQSGSRQKEQPPAAFPKNGILPIDLLQNWPDLINRIVEIVQPIQSCLLIMASRPAPILLDGENIVEAMRQVEGRHDAASEEMMCDPVGGIFMVEAIGTIAMREDMNEQSSICMKPSAYAFKQGLLVRHMFKHFHRNHTIKALVDGKIVHVGGNNGEVLKTARCCLCFDIGAL